MYCWLHLKAWQKSVDKEKREIELISLLVSLNCFCICFFFFELSYLLSVDCIGHKVLFSSKFWFCVTMQIMILSRLVSCVPIGYSIWFCFASAQTVIDTLIILQSSLIESANIHTEFLINLDNDQQTDYKFMKITFLLSFVCVCLLFTPKFSARISHSQQMKPYGTKTISHSNFIELISN